MFAVLDLARPQAMLPALSPQNIDGKSYLAQDLNVPCWDVDHQLWVFAMGLPAVLLYVLGIPAGAFIIMFRRRHILDTEATKTTFGMVLYYSVAAGYILLCATHVACLLCWQAFCTMATSMLTTTGSASL